MPLTQLDTRSALLLNDLQKGIVRQALGPTDPRDVVARCLSLARAFASAALPVVLISVAGGPPGRVERELILEGPITPEFSELVPELDDIAQTAIRISTRNWNAFYGTSLDLELRRRGITQVVVGGISTSSGVESTARSAHDRGFHVAIAMDAVTDFDPKAHQNSLERVFPKLGETDSAERIIAVLSEQPSAS